MRDDLVGMFWDDTPVKGARGSLTRVMPPIPDTGWLAPREFPNLRSAPAIAVDTETKDPNLEDKGPGWARGDGHIVGVSVAVDGAQWYFPMRHEIEPEHNLDPSHVLRWLRDTLGNPHQPKVGANLYYDIGWLGEEGVPVAGELVDVQHGEALLVERGEVNLDYLGHKYLGTGKESNYLYRWCSDYYGGPVSDRQRANIYRAPPRLVGPYAERDAQLPLAIARAQHPLLARENLLPVLAMENGLIQLMVAMRRAGVSVDIPRAERLRERLFNEATAAQHKLDTLVGRAVNVNASDSIARAFDALSLPYPRTAPTKATPQGRPSFTKVWLQHQTNPIANLINTVRKLHKLRSTFVESYILDSHVNGRIHGQFHLLRSDDGGTRSGRLSSSTPNLQNLPSRDAELAPLVRGIFVPDTGHKQWRRYDYSQIEFRLLVHHAVGAGANEARARYCNDPTTDYHEYVIELLRGYGVDLDRRPAKNLNFGLVYGMGVLKLIRELGLDKVRARELFDTYHEAIPYAKATMEACSEEASSTGIITTLLGRRSRFDLWEPAERYDTPVKRVGLPYEQALRQYGRVRRAYTHKGLNRKLQGGAADVIKNAMFQAWRDGVFARTGVPRLTVHDELDHSDPGDCDDAFAELRHILENATRLSVPIVVAEDIGADWAATS